MAATRTNLIPHQGLQKIVTCCWISIIVVTSSPAVSSQLVTVTSDISPGDVLCPGTEVNFTCTTRNTAILIWSSNEYIGNPLEVNSRDNLDQIQRGSIDSNTTATLVSRSVENDTILVLVSQLRITVSSISLNPSVTCIHDGDNVPDVFSFQVLATPAVPQVIAEYPMGSCELNISMTAPDNIAVNDTDRFMVDIDGMNVKNDTSLSLSYPVSSCATRNVRVITVDRCDRESSPAMVAVDPGQVCVCSVNAAVDNTVIVGSVVGSVAGLAIVAVIVVVIIGLVYRFYIEKGKERKKGARTAKVSPTKTKEPSKSGSDTCTKPGT